MKQHQLLMVAALITTVMCGSVIGEYNDDRIFGNGRLLRRLRDDVMGRNQQAAKPKKANKPTVANRRATGKTPTPAIRPTAKTPTPAVRPGRAPTPALRNTQSRANQTIPAAGNRGTVQPSATEATIGFGMQLEMRGKQMVVTKIDPRGNAYKSGVRYGDIVVDAGGMGLGSVDEINEVADILDPGDQLEFEIQRRGKTEKLMIQFGTSPEESGIAEAKPARKINYSFVPTTNETYRSGMRSVVEPPPQGYRAIHESVPQPIRTSKRSVPSRGSGGNHQRTIEQQRQQIEQMRLEIERLRTGSRSAFKGSNL